MAKTKSKSCNKGYPCGRSCISRRFGCKKKLKGQASTYAGWLKKQGENLSESFNREAGIRIGKEAGKLRRERSGSVIDQFAQEMLGVLDSASASILRSDKNLLEMIEQDLQDTKKEVENLTGQAISRKLNKDEQNNLAMSQKRILKLTQEQKALQDEIAKREKELDSTTPKNQIKSFTREDEIDKAIRNLRNKNISSEIRDDLKKLNDLRGELKNIKAKYIEENNIIRFKRPRNFAENGDVLFQYLTTRNKILSLLKQSRRRLS